jgi:hypothetical protein
MDVAREWLPPGKIAAICFSIDDVHPGTWTYCDHGEYHGAGVLGNQEWLVDRHPKLRMTDFVTPDWRQLFRFRIGSYSRAFRFFVTTCTFFSFLSRCRNKVEMRLR